MSDQEALVARRMWVRRNIRMAIRGQMFALFTFLIVMSGVLPLSAGAASTLIGLATLLAISRTVRGLFAARVARHLMGGWRQRRISAARAPLQITGPVQDAVEVMDSANHRAVRTLASSQEPLVSRARARGLELADQMERLSSLLGDGGLSSALRRPVAEELAWTESELEALLGLMSELSRADQQQKDDLRGALKARLEVEARVPVGLYAPA